MKQGQTTIFKNKSKLYLLINLRLNGWALSSLANYFECDKSSLYYIFEKYWITEPEKVFTIERITKNSLDKNVPDTTFKIINEEHINLGKSYKEYLIDAGYNPKKVKYEHIFS